MSINWNYMPILKWKQGEQLALRHLTKVQRQGVMPLIELQPIDAAPDTNSIKAALPSYLTDVTNKIEKSIPEDNAVCIDTGYLSLGYPRQASLLLSVCNYLQRKTSRRIIPVIHAAVLESLELLAVTLLEFLKKQEIIVLRIRTDQIEPFQIASSVAAMISMGIEKRSIHILIDQYSLVDRQYSDCFDAVKPYLDNATKATCASVTVGGGSFPVNLMGRRQGITDIPRIEWKVWKLLQESKVYPGLRYADYTVTNPAPIPDIDGIAMNPSIAIRYAANDFWRLFKGRGFKSGVPGEYRNLCKLLISDISVFSGEHFSYGDYQYNGSASGSDKNGNPSSWRKEATNHHIALVANALAVPL